MVPTAESEGKAVDGKDRNPTKKSKGASGNASSGGGKAGDSGKAASSSGNDGGTQRCVGLNFHCNLCWK